MTPGLGIRDLLVCLLLALVGGFADAGSYVLVGAFTGHVTGNAVLAAIAGVTRHWSNCAASVLAVGAFMAGTVIGSVWPHPAQRQAGPRLVQPIAAEIVLIAAGGLAATRLPDLGRSCFLACLCLALGLQNGVLNKVGPVSIHSTYITGMSTSLVSTGTAQQPATTKRATLAGVIASFVTGAALGGALVSGAGLIGFTAILLPLGLALLLASPLFRRATG